MNLRRMIPAAVFLLFAVAGFAASEEPADEDTRRETIYDLAGDPVPGEKNDALNKELFQLAAGKAFIWANPPPLAAAREDGGGDRIYNVAAPLEDGAVDELGFTGGDEEEDKPAFPVVDETPSGVLSGSEKASYSFFLFEGRAFKNGKNTVRTMFDELYRDAKTPDVESLFTLLSLPIALVFMALGAGAFMILLTTKSKE